MDNEQRVLKARGRSKQTNKIITGFPFSDKYGIKIIHHVTTEPGYEKIEFDDIWPESLGYETGKFDRNGNMIYGGMKVKDLMSGKIGRVYWGYGKWIYEAPGECGLLHDKYDSLIEIVEEA